VLLHPPLHPPLLPLLPPLLPPLPEVKFHNLFYIKEVILFIE
jgi:hypothetical protein